MNLKGIISIAGQPGLFKIVSQAKFGLVAESLLDNRRMPVYASQRVSTLLDISIYTSGDDMPLKDVFARMKEKTNNEKGPEAKSDPETLRGFFESVLPEYDRERVYISDIRKVINWYNILLEKGILDQPEEEEDVQQEAGTEKESDSKAEATVEKEPAETKKKKTPAKKKSTAKKTASSGGGKVSSKAGNTSRGAARKTTTPRKTGG